MVHKINVYTRSCPYCNSSISKEYYSPDKWGLKYGRCSKCKGIFKTGKQLYSDLSPKEKRADKEEVFQALKIIVPIFLITFVVACITGWELVGLLAFMAFVGILAVTLSYHRKTKFTLKKYNYLKETDPELYRLEYAESMRILKEKEIHRK